MKIKSLNLLLILHLILSSIHTLLYMLDKRGKTCKTVSVIDFPLLFIRPLLKEVKNYVSHSLFIHFFPHHILLLLKPNEWDISNWKNLPLQIENMEINKVINCKLCPTTKICFSQISQVFLQIFDQISIFLSWKFLLVHLL